MRASQTKPTQKVFAEKALQMANAGAEKPSGDGPCMRTKQLLAYIGVSRTTLHVWRKRKMFPAPIELTARVKVWRRSEIDAWLHSHARAAA